LESGFIVLQKLTFLSVCDEF